MQILEQAVNLVCPNLLILSSIPLFSLGDLTINYCLSKSFIQIQKVLSLLKLIQGEVKF